MGPLFLLFSLLPPYFDLLLLTLSLAPLSRAAPLPKLTGAMRRNYRPPTFRPMAAHL
jgi:hypothetical protein